MRLNTQSKQGLFWNAGRQYMPLSEVPRTLNLNASEVSDAVALGRLQIERLSGCKCVSIESLFDFIAMRVGKK